MARAVRRPAARRDFINHYVYLAENASLEAAKRFRDAVEATYADLAKMPRMGSPAKSYKESTRVFVSGECRDFENYLIAYRPHRDGIAIERLLHAKQDYQRVLK